MIDIKPLQFLQTIFFDVPADESILVAKPIHRGEFTGRFRQLRPDHKSFQAFSDGGKPADWYFGIATVANTASTTLKRRKQDMRAVYVVVLDDVGTKCKVPPVPASYVLETSEGNFQYGYLLTTPVDNMQWYEIFMQLLGEAGYADVGTLDSTRVMRVPGSKNVKPGKNGFLSRLTKWSPELTYDMPDLAKAFEVKLPAENKVPRISYLASAYSDCELPEIQDPVFEWLQERGVVRGQQGNGFFEIQCPWHDAHSDGRDEAGYKPLGLGDTPEYRQFKCHHSHAETTTDFLAWVHEHSGLDVGNCDDNALRVALQQLAKVTGVPIEETPGCSAPDTESYVVPFGQAVNHEEFPHRIKVGTGKNSKVVPMLTVDNIVALLDAHGVRRVHNLVTRRVYATVDGDTCTAEYVYGQIRSQAVLNEFSALSGFRDVYNAAITRTTDKVNPVADWLKSLEWDGTSRLRALIDCIETDDTDIRNLAVPAWLAQCVAFALGDNGGGGSVLVLTGRGGIGKTAWLQRLVPAELGEYMKTGIIMSPSNKDDIAKACSAWITELGELDGTFKRSDMAVLKAFLTDEYDFYRPPYAAEVQEHKRFTSFAATVNDTVFLSDMTGGGYRRFWVLNCDHITWDHGIDMTQLWAEVYYLYSSGRLSRRLDSEDAETVERSAREAALYNDDIVIQDMRRLWPDLTAEAYAAGTIKSRLTEREIYNLLPAPELAGCSEQEVRRHCQKIRAFLKDNTPRSAVTFAGRSNARIMSKQGGAHKWLLPLPVARRVERTSD